MLRRSGGLRPKRDSHRDHGPFIEIREVLGGHWMIRVDAKAAAIAWAKHCPAGDSEVIEIRQVQEFEDLPADVQKAAAGFNEMHVGSAAGSGA